jgi:hypothetical protein
MKKSLFLPALLLLFFNCSNVYSQNKLDKSKKELNANSAASSDSSNSKPASSSKPDNEDTNLGLQVLGYVFFGVFKYGLIGDYNNEEHLQNELTPYPFYKSKVGNFQDTEGDSVTGKQFRLDLENHFIYSNNTLFGNHLEAKIRPFQYFYLQTDYYQLFEYDTFTNTRDQLSLFYFNVGYDRVRLERFNLGWTLGASYIGNEVKKAGFSYGVNAEYFLSKHISFSGEAKWSSINSNPVNSYKIQSKFFRKNYFLGIGFERLKIATPVYNLIGIGGGIYF